jgi:hypothetical protein
MRSTDIVAGTIFKTPEQKETDHLPGYGTIAEDSADTNQIVRNAWNCSTGEAVEVSS